MAGKTEFVEYLLELLEPFGRVKVKVMFGGFGIFRRDLMFGLVADDTLYLKVDEKSRSEFQSKGLDPFVYKMKGKEFAMSYYQAPAEAMEDPEEMAQWAKKAYDAAKRAAQRKRIKKRGGKLSPGH
jgi:DNA transformation protein